MRCRRTSAVIYTVLLVSYISGFSGPAYAQKKDGIVWDPGRIEETLDFGGYAQIVATVVSASELEGVSFWVTPELEPYVRIQPAEYALLESNVPYQVTITLSIPDGTYPGLYEGTVHVREGKRTRPETLKVALNVFYEGVFIPSTTKAFNGSASDYILAVSDDQSCLTLSAIPPEIGTLVAGDIIVVGVTTRTPYGLLRRVTAVYGVGAYIMVEMVSASLAEAIETGSVDAHVQLYSEGIESEALPSLTHNYTSSIAQFHVAAEISAFDFHIPIDTILWDADDRPETRDNQIRIVGNVEFTSAFHFRLLIEDSSLEQLYFTNEIEESAEITLKAQFSYQHTVEETTLYQEHLSAVTFWVGWIPVVVVPKIEVVGGATVEASAYVETTITQEATLEAGIEYIGGDLNSVWSFTNDWGYSPPNPTGNLSAKGYAGPKLTLLLYGLAGPYASVNGYLRLEAGLSRVPLWSLYGGLEGDVGIDWEAISSLLDMDGDERLSLLSGEWLIAQAPTSSGSISGSVKDAAILSPLEGVTVRAFSESIAVGSGTTNTNGGYTISVPPGSGYRVEFTRTGYLSATQYDVSVTEGATTHLQVLLQIDLSRSGPGNASGYVRNALNGVGVTALSVKLRQGINATTGNVVASATTQSSGYYSFVGITAGNYTAEVTGMGYVTTYFTLLCIGGTTTNNQDATVTPILPPGEIRIVLTWGATPSDLDSHLTGPLPGGMRFHMYYPYAEANAGSPWPAYVTLDRDDITSYGPETTTIHQQLFGVYRFTVHDYSNRYSSTSKALSNSNAQVRVYRGSDSVRSFYVPSDTPGTAWTVFELSSDWSELKEIGSMSFTPSPISIWSISSVDDDLALLQELPEKE